MASKPLIIASLLGASVGVPYFASKSNSNGAAAPHAAAPVANSATTATPAPPLLGAPPVHATPTTAASPITAAAPGASLNHAVPKSPSAEQALQFNLTKDWVYRSWDRKTSTPTDLGLLAVRVPMVSGTQTGSLAGSLTYYFNPQDQLEHISFRGTTGDPTKLVQFLVRNYQFQPIPGQPGEQVYQVSDSGGIHSELRTQPVSIVATNSPYANYSVDLELARPGSERYLPPRGPFVQAPPSAASQQPLAAAESAPAAAPPSDPETSGSGYFDKVRYATPQEQIPKTWRRWPN